MQKANQLRSVDLGSLSGQQLSQVKKQLDDELEHLTNSFAQLRAAQAKFRECLRSISTGITPKAEGMGGILGCERQRLIIGGLQIKRSWCH